MNNYVFIWLAVIVVCIIIEAVTAGLTTVWAVGGGIAALIVSFFEFGRYSFAVQIYFFIAVTAVLVIMTRPFLINRMKLAASKTNTEELLGKTALVIEGINEFETGQVKINGQTWTAVSEKSEEIKEGDKVTVERIEGVKLVVVLQEKDKEIINNNYSG